MGKLRLRTPMLFAIAVVLTTTTMTVPAGAAPGPVLSEPVVALANTLSCPDTFHGRHEPVLLVHGTAGSPATFAANYGRVLPRMGYDVCAVELVDEGRGDIQASAERVAYAVRAMAERSHRKVQVVGHSMGPLVVRWALKWWPDVAPLVDDMIGIASPQHGWRGTGDETPGDVSYTSVYAVTDELVQPFWTSDLEGGVNLKTQDLCPGRVGEHHEMLSDAAAYGVVLDALTHPGPADLSRVDRALCLRLTMPGTATADLAAREIEAWTVGGAALLEHHVDREPPLADYARSEGGRP